MALLHAQDRDWTFHWVPSVCRLNRCRNVDRTSDLVIHCKNTLRGKPRLERVPIANIGVSVSRMLVSCRDNFFFKIHSRTPDQVIHRPHDCPIEGFAKANLGAGWCDVLRIGLQQAVVSHKPAHFSSARWMNCLSFTTPFPNITAEYSDFVFVSRMYCVRSAEKNMRRPIRVRVLRERQVSQMSDFDFRCQLM
jgi:hypothetical protein